MQGYIYFLFVDGKWGCGLYTGAGYTRENPVLRHCCLYYIAVAWNSKVVCRGGWGAVLLIPGTWIRSPAVNPSFLTGGESKNALVSRFRHTLKICRWWALIRSSPLWRASQPWCSFHANPKIWFFFFSFFVLFEILEAFSICCIFILQLGVHLSYLECSQTSY